MPLVARYRSRRPGAALARIVFFDTCRWITWVYIRLGHGYRRRNKQRLPDAGPYLIVCNHQSFLDPLLAGNAVYPHQMTSLARHGLFQNFVMGPLLRTLYTVPVRQGESDPKAIKSIIAELKAGYPVLIFPEGSRTYDGALQPFQRGVALILRRAACPVLPVAVEGAFDAWPRTRSLPRAFRTPVRAMVGDPIPYDELMADGPDEALRRLEREIDAMRLQLRAELRAKSKGRYPAPSAGDEPFTTPSQGVRRDAEGATG